MVLGFLSGLRAQEIIIILLVVLVLFGAKKLPEIGRGMGKGIKEFKEGIKDVSDEVQKGMEDDTSDAGSTEASSREPDRPTGG